jgi:hypothetical protein
MLPFLKQNKEAGMSAPVETERRKPDEHSEIDGLEQCMEELHSALMAKRYKEAAEIFRSCFEFLDAQPHEEGEHG